MPDYRPGKLVRLHLSEQDRHDNRPLYEAIVQKCMDLKIAGATVFRGLEGYGETTAIHRGHVLAHDLPVVIQIIDSAETIERLLSVLEAMMDTGLIAISDVEMRRVEKAAGNLPRN